MQGTLNVLKACQKYKIRRVIVTSSTAAVIDKVNAFKGKVVSEKDWADESTSPSAYTKAKIL